MVEEVAEEVAVVSPEELQVHIQSFKLSFIFSNLHSSLILSSIGGRGGRGDRRFGPNSGRGGNYRNRSGSVGSGAGKGNRW